MLGIKQMAPSDRQDFDIDFSDWIPDGDTISAVECSVDPDGDVSVDDTDIASPSVKVWVVAPAYAPEATYEIDVKVTTAGGRTKTVCFKIRVRDC